MNKRNLLIDAIIFFAFLIAMVPNLTGEPIHEWLSLALLATVVVHLLLHWDWIIEVGSIFFKKFWYHSRLKFFVDIFVFLSFITVCLSGILISKTALPALGIDPGQIGMTWRRLHSLSADASLLLIGIHFALNWEWVACTVKKYVLSPIGGLFRRKSTARQPLQDAAIEQQS